MLHVCYGRFATYLNIGLNIELESFVLKLHNFHLNQNNKFLFNIELKIKDLKACPNEPLWPLTWLLTYVQLMIKAKDKPHH